jgi:capsular exopolysaccharide synthesis family protein
MPQHRAEEPPTSLPSDLARLARRRWRIIAVIAVLAPALALGLSLQQRKQFAAVAEVLISRQNLANALTNTQDPNLNTDEDRMIRTQATLARNAEVTSRALRAAGLGNRDPEKFGDYARVDEQPLADVLAFTVRDPSPQVAERLATAWATEFSAYRRSLDTAAIVEARASVERSLAELSRGGLGQSAQAGALEGEAQQLRTLETLQTRNARVVQPAVDAEQVAPRPLRNTAFALVIGALLAFLAALVRDALDDRVRSADELADRLGASLLGRLPAPAGRGGRAGTIDMLDEPRSPLAEATRALRANVEIATVAGELDSLVITSAVEQEGKSTTAANLAVTLARTGRHVVLADLDLRRPAVHRLFDLEASPGVMDVLLGHVTLDEALVEIPVSPDPGDPGDRPASGGRLEVLTAGFTPSDPSELFSSVRFRALLAELRAAGQILLVDSAPLLPVSDTLALAPQVGGIVVLTRIDRIRRTMLRELVRVLARSGGRVVGVVTTGDAQVIDMYGYGSYESAEVPDRLGRGRDAPGAEGLSTRAVESGRPAG